MISTLEVKHYDHVTERPFEEVIRRFEQQVGSVEDGEFRRISTISEDAGEFERRVKRYPPATERSAPSARAPRSSTGSSSRAKQPGAGHPLIGVRVRHATYGNGTIIGVEGEDEERKLTVSFSDHGTKKLIERYANLVRA